MHPSTFTTVCVSASLIGLSQATGIEGSAGNQPKWLHRRLATSIMENVQTVTSNMNYMSCTIKQGAFAAASALGMGTLSSSSDCVQGSSIVTAPKVVIAAFVSAASSASSQSTPTAAAVSNSNSTSTTNSTDPMTTPQRALPAVNTTMNPNMTMTPPLRFTQLSNAAQSVIIDPKNPCSSNDTEVCYEQYLALDAHNKAREAHFAPPLVWNDTLAAASLVWATQCVWKHSHGSMFPVSYVTGENLYASTQPLPLTTMTTAIKGFMNEEAAYNYSAPGFSDTTGHFTQVVWKSTQQFGCAIVNCDLDIFNVYTNASSFAVCTYWPSGNYAGEFAKNVFAPNVTQAPANN